MKNSIQTRNHHDLSPNKKNFGPQRQKPVNTQKDYRE